MFWKGANRDAGRMPIEPSNINSMMEVNKMMSMVDFDVFPQDGLIDGVEIDLGRFTKQHYVANSPALSREVVNLLGRYLISSISLAEIVVFVVTISIYGFTSPSNNNMIGPSSEAFLELGAKYTPYILKYACPVEHVAF
eukprot:766827-Hanusia_phi.AAC.2